MHPTTTTSEVTQTTMSARSQPEPEKVVTARIHLPLEAVEWRTVRKGLDMMVGSSIAFLVSLLVISLTWRFGAYEPLLPFIWLCLLVVPLSGIVFMAGVVPSMNVPPAPRPSLSVWILTPVVCLIAALGLLFAAYLWRTGPRIHGVSWKPGVRVLLWAAVLALLLAHLGYCLSLAGIAWRFGARSVARGCLVLCLCLVLQTGLIARTQVTYAWQPNWQPYVRVDWTIGFLLCTSGMLLVTAAAWTVLLYQLRRCLPQEEPTCEAVGE